MVAIDTIVLWLRDGALYSGNADVHPRAERVLALYQVEIHFGVDRQIVGQLDLHCARRACDRPFEACRPAGRKQLLGIRAWPVEPGIDNFTSSRPSELRD